MPDLETLRAGLPAAAEDIAHNLGAVLLAPSSLEEPQRWGVALASAYATRAPELIEAISHEAEKLQQPSLREDARVAAVLMAQNNVYYRFRHQVGQEGYRARHVRLRMDRRRRVHSELDFELFSLAVSALFGCESCVRHHERAVRAAGLTEDHVNDTIRIAATIHAAAVALALR